MRVWGAILVGLMVVGCGGRSQSVLPPQDGGDQPTSEASDPGSTCSQAGLFQPSADAVQLVVDVTHVFWIEQQGRVMAVSKQGSSLRVVAQGLSFPLALALAGDRVFVAERDDARIVLVSKAGGDATRLWAGEQGTWPVAVAADDREVFWVTQYPAAVYAAAQTGGAARQLATWKDENVRQPTSVAIDDRFVYWTDFADGKVWRVRKEGGAPELMLASGLGYESVVVDASFVFVADRLAGEVWVVDKAQLTPRALAKSQSGLRGLAMSDEAVYWTRGMGDKEVVRMGKMGGDARILAEGQDDAKSLVVDGECLYWVSSQGVMRGASQ